MIRHHKARRLALQGLCCLDAQGWRAMEAALAFIDDSDEPPETLAEAREMVREAFDHREECDLLMVRHARHWGLERLAMVDRNILRLAVWELRNRHTPFKVVISEAMRLASEFSTAESPRFVNGVLDAVAKEISRDAGDTGDKD